MNKFNISSILVVLGLAFSVSAIAQNMSKDEHEAVEKQIVAEYKLDKAQCESLTGNAEDICMAEAKGKEKVAKAELEAKFKPSKEADYKVSVAKAEANYALLCSSRTNTEKQYVTVNLKINSLAPHFKGSAKPQKYGSIVL